jgi:hypothetical protein
MRRTKTDNVEAGYVTREGETLIVSDYRESGTRKFKIKLEHDFHLGEMVRLCREIAAIRRDRYRDQHDRMAALANGVTAK